jgi:hypothetical protein
MSEDIPTEASHYTIATEDDSESWEAHRMLEEAQRREEEETPAPKMSTVEILERLRKAHAILDVADARIDHLTWTIHEMIQRLKRKDQEFRDGLRDQLKM